MSIVLMYHGIYRDAEDLQRISVEDQPYAISAETFRQQLDMLSAHDCGLMPEDGSSPPQIVLSFDDGHASNFDLAFPLLQEFNVKAYFFVTTDFIDHREHFCRWQDLCTMSDAGMVIGSHGKTHRFFEDMEKGEAVNEFNHSAERLQTELGKPATSISFPGGRYSVENLRQARHSGYEQIFGSRFGTIGSGEWLNGDALKRIPVRSSTSHEDFLKIISEDRLLYISEHIKFVTKNSIKKLIGNERYHALYKYAADRR